MIPIESPGEILTTLENVTNLFTKNGLNTLYTIMDQQYAHLGERAKKITQSLIYPPSEKAIAVIEDKIKIHPEKLEVGPFYLISYLDGRYIIQKVNEDIINIYEVIE